MLADPVAANGYRWRMVAHGVDTLCDYFRELSRYSLDGRADTISCPTLALAGEGDFAGTGQLDVFAKALTAPVTTHEFTVSEGARRALRRPRPGPARPVRLRLARAYPRPIEWDAALVRLSRSPTLSP